MLPRMIGLSKAKLLAFTGEMIDAKEAERLGLVEKVVSPGQLLASAEELAGRLARGPKSIGFMKKIITESLSQSFDTFLSNMADHFYQAVQSQDHEEAIKAWLEKRKPVFKGK